MAESKGRLPQPLVGGDDFCFARTAGCSKMQGIVGSDEDGRVHGVASVHDLMELRANGGIANGHHNHLVREVGFQRGLDFQCLAGSKHALGFFPAHGGPEFQGGEVTGDTGGT